MALCGLLQNSDIIGYSLWPDPKYKKILIGGEKKSIYSSDYVNEPSGDKLIHRDIIIPFEKNKGESTYIHIAYFYYKNPATLDEFNQMLSTFKFIDQH